MEKEKYYPDEKLGCTLMNYCMYYNGDLTLDELLKKEIKTKENSLMEIKEKDFYTEI